MEIKYFENGFVGKAVYDTNEAIKCFNAGMDVSSEIGDFLYENMEGNLPNDSEVISRIIESIQEFGKVYVGFYLEGKKVVDINTTTLTCDFKIGQSVYFLDNGEICSATIKGINLTANESMETVCINRLESLGGYIKNNNSHVDWIVSDLKKIGSGNCVYLRHSGKGHPFIMPINKVFPTKEALVQDLLSKSK